MNDIPASNPSVMILTQRDMARLMRPADYRHAVTDAFRALGRGLGTCPPPMHIAAAGGGFHVKGAAFAAGELGPAARGYAAFKVNGNFPGNPERNGLPTIQGALLLCDADTGSPLALMDSAEITVQRTAAASAVAAQHLARPDAGTITVCGCGEQAFAQLRALADVLPLRRGFAWDRDPARADRLARLAAQLGVAMRPAADLGEAARQSEVIATCTTARAPFLDLDHVSPGAFVVAVGADWAEKSEIAPPLMARARVVVDVLEQCLEMGDLHHAVAAGVMRPDDVHATLGDLVAGARPGRAAPDQITLFDSTGVAVQDVAAAAVLFERALAAAAEAPMRVALSASAA